MSTAKVEQRKKEKYNRKKILAKQKRHKIYAIIVTVAIGLGVCGWIGKGVFDKYFYYDSIQEIDMESFSSAISALTEAGYGATADNGTEAEK